MDPLFLFLLLGLPAISQMVASRMRSQFVRFSQFTMPYTGREIAELMLSRNGIHDVEVTATRGQLTDHYDPIKKTVNLSESVYHERNIAAVSVAAHECGHAIQDKVGYPFLVMRSKMVPLLRMSSLALPILCFGGAGVSAVLGQKMTGFLFIFALGLPALFSLITLPVEFNASSRALEWMEMSGLVEGEQHKRAKNALFWAAMTYVIAALGSIAQLLYFARVFMPRRGSSR
ncbi:MAG: zinc metallopeptidase [Planctomycetota bacterium]